jgi:uncharacterized protein YkwD
MLRSLLAIAPALALIARVATADGPASPQLVWKDSSSSPQTAAATHARHAALHALCGTPDAALNEVAARNVQRQLAGLAPIASDELAFSLRAAGDPHVWPRAWSIAGGGLDEDDIQKRVKAWVGSSTALGVRRCGVARGSGPEGTGVVAAVAIDALADMSPLPTSARVGQWLTLQGTMLVPASAAKVVLLGPRGAPKTVIASISNGRIRSTFNVDSAGAWLVQVMATVSTGPRPVLEAMIFAGTTPPNQFVRAPAPGEDAGKGAKTDGEAMLRMVNAARASEGLPAVTRDTDLERLAMQHSEAMKKVKMVGHDVGDGDPRARVDASGLRLHIVGENAAGASTLEGAHRALWASPSHRENILMGQFKRVGVAVVRGDDGAVWVTQLFAD